MLTSCQNFCQNNYYSKIEIQNLFFVISVPTFFWKQKRLFEIEWLWKMDDVCISRFGWGIDTSRRFRKQLAQHHNFRHTTNQLTNTAFITTTSSVCNRNIISIFFWQVRTISKPKITATAKYCNILKLWNLNFERWNKRTDGKMEWMV